MYPIKQSTAITVPFFVHDVSGDAVTGLTDGSFTKRISKGSAAFAAMTVAITEMENGWYSIPLSTTHSDTLGLLTVVFTNAGAKQTNLQFRVHARLPDDLAFPTTSGRSTDTLATGEVPIDFDTSIGSLAAAQIEASALDGKGDWNIGKTAYSLTQAFPTNFAALSITAGGLVDITQAAADKVWSTTTRTLTAFSTALALSVWDVLESAIVTASTIGLKVKNNLDAVLSDVEADTQDIQSRLPASLVGGAMDANVSAMQANSIASGTIASGELTNIENEIWDALKSAHVVANSFGDFLDIEVSGRLAAADINLTAGVLDEVATVTGHTAQTGDSFARIGAAGASLTDLGGMSTAMKAEVLVEINAALDTTIAELGVALPAITPTLRTGLMLLYMALRNKLDVQTSGTDALEVHNDAGTQITSKLLTDAGGDYSEAKMT